MQIDEYVGNGSNGDPTISIAKVVSKGKWAEDWQAPAFDECVPPVHASLASFVQPSDSFGHRNLLVFNPPVLLGRLAQLVFIGFPTVIVCYALNCPSSP